MKYHNSSKSLNIVLPYVPAKLNLDEADNNSHVIPELMPPFTTEPEAMIMIKPELRAVKMPLHTQLRMRLEC
jgi:hypothetical protein